MEHALTLTELNLQVRDAIQSHFSETYWLRAETSDVRQNQNGHCYLEFVEKDEKSQTIVARARGIIWGNTFRMLKAYFETETGQIFASGLNVLVRVSLDFHELYGFSLTVVDIDPTFTLGDMARNRALVLKQLEEEGVLSLNKELVLPELTQRIAVISSPTAAGYEDFCNQLQYNDFVFTFYPKLFPAVMQGERSEASIIGALEKVYEYSHLFDAVAIIRGGGATSELSCFDAYLLAYHCAQFPLPIISGVGHERDVTVLDVVAHTRAKTPTAVADFLITHLSKTAHAVVDLEERLLTKSAARLREEESALFAFSKDIFYQSDTLLKAHFSHIDLLTSRIKIGVKLAIRTGVHLLEKNEQYIAMSAPENILKRGYTMTLKYGKIVQSAHQLSEKDIIETRFADGNINSQII